MKFKFDEFGCIKCSTVSLKEILKAITAGRGIQDALLYEYFNIRKERYWGSKKSFAWLKANDPKTYHLFEEVLKHPLKLNLLKKLVERVSELKIKN